MTEDKQQGEETEKKSQIVITLNSPESVVGTVEFKNINQASRPLQLIAMGEWLALQGRQILQQSWVKQQMAKAGQIYLPGQGGPMPPRG